MDKVLNLGQIFTKQDIVEIMYGLKKIDGSILEPACGDGAFVRKGVACIEIDPEVCPSGAINMDFFDFPTDIKFHTIIGNPPYVAYKNIMESTKALLNHKLFDERTNLYIFFIHKALQQLEPFGEIIFIVPRELFVSTSAKKLNEILLNQGTFTDIITFGDKKIFKDATPNVLIFRYEQGNFNRNCSYDGKIKQIKNNNGYVFFTENDYTMKLSDIASVKVGGVSGNDKLFYRNDGNIDVLCSTRLTKKMVYGDYAKIVLDKNKAMQRHIRKFDDSNWWEWGRDFYKSNAKRVYVNCRTRNAKPFFIHDAKYYDGSIFGIFPNNQDMIEEFCEALNEVDWNDLGFICDGRFLFTQQRLENTLLPECFKKFIV